MIPTEDQKVAIVEATLDNDTELVEKVFDTVVEEDHCRFDLLRRYLRRFPHYRGLVWIRFNKCLEHNMENWPCDELIELLGIFDKELRIVDK